MSCLETAHENLMWKLAACAGCAAPPSLMVEPPAAPAPIPPVRQLPPVQAAQPAKPPSIPKLAGYEAGEAALEKAANWYDPFLTPFAKKNVPATDMADFQTVNDINSMKTNPNRIRDPGMIYHPDGTVSVKPGEVPKPYVPTENAAAGVGENVGKEVGKEVEKKGGGLLSKITGKGLALGGLGVLAAGGLAYGAYRHSQNRQQQSSQLGAQPVGGQSPQIGSGAYQAGYGY